MGTEKMTTKNLGPQKIYGKNLRANLSLSFATIASLPWYYGGGILSSLGTTLARSLLREVG